MMVLKLTPPSSVPAPAPIPTLAASAEMPRSGAGRTCRRGPSANVSLRVCFASLRKSIRCYTLVSDKDLHPNFKNPQNFSLICGFPPSTLWFCAFQTKKLRSTSFYLAASGLALTAAAEMISLKSGGSGSEDTSAPQAGVAQNETIGGAHRRIFLVHVATCRSGKPSWKFPAFFWAAAACAPLFPRGGSPIHCSRPSPGLWEKGAFLSA